MSRFGLFDDEDNGDAPRPFSRKGTSEEAAKSMGGHAARQRARVADFVFARGLRGATSQEIAARLDMGIQSVTARLNDLESTKPTERIRRLRETIPLQLFVIDKDDADGRVDRPNPSGRLALVYF